jgi:ribosomal protein S18 acetylase RimI-like enzyme
MYSFAPLRWSHYAACKWLFEDAFDISEVPWFIKSWRERSDNSIGVFNCGSIVGFALIDTKMFLRYICINPEFQNCGLGSKLLTKVLNLCDEYRSIWLTTAGDERLVDWYSRFGFRVVETRTEDGEFIGADMVRRARCRSASKQSGFL